MAKKSKKKKTTTYRKRRVSGIGGDVVSQIAGGIAGAVLGKIATNAIVKMLPTVNAKTLNWGAAAAQVVGGFLLTSKSKNPLFKGAGMGLSIGGGLKVVAIVMPSLSVGRAPVMIPMRSNGMVGGFEDVPRLGAVTTPNGGFPRPSTVGSVANMAAVYAGGIY